MTAAVTDQPQHAPDAGPASGSGPVLAASQVEHARQNLRDDADWLCTVQSRVVEFDDGEQRPFTAPAPLTLVEQELAGGGAPIGVFAPHSKPPLGIDALTLLAAIDNLTFRPHTIRGLGGQPDREGPDRAQWVWDWAQAMAATAPGIVVDAAKTVATWRSSVEGLLDPKPRFRVRGQRCPACGAAKVWERDGQADAAGERHARPALEVDPSTGITFCLCCSSTWSPELHEHLRQVLEQQREETLAAGGGDPTVTARTATEASVARLAELAVLGQHLAAVPEHAPRVVTGLDDGVVPVQCSARVPVISDGEPKRRDGRVVDQRCPALLDADGGCYLADRHRDQTQAEVDDEGDVPEPGEQP